MLNGKTFGFINGNITILSIIVGLYASNNNKKAMFSAILAMMIADPLCDAYALYFAEKEKPNNESNARKLGVSAFLSQFFVQLAFLFIIIKSKSTKSGALNSLYFAFCSIILYGYLQKLSFKEQVLNIFSVIALLLVTYKIEQSAHFIF